MKIALAAEALASGAVLVFAVEVMWVGGVAVEYFLGLLLVVEVAAVIISVGRNRGHPRYRRLTLRGFTRPAVRGV